MPTCEFRFIQYWKDITSALNYWHIVALPSAYLKYAAVYNDGSFLQGSEGCAFVLEHKLFPHRLRSFDCAYTAELQPLYWALLFIRQRPRRISLLCTESLSVLNNLHGHTPDRPVVLEILRRTCRHNHEVCRILLDSWLQRSACRRGRRCIR
jgi:hypothetical protein